MTPTRRIALVVLAMLFACDGGGSGLSDSYKATLMENCEEDGPKAVRFCRCVIEYYEGLEKSESELTMDDHDAARNACPDDPRIQG